MSLMSLSPNLSKARLRSTRPLQFVVPTGLLSSTAFSDAVETGEVFLYHKGTLKQLVFRSYSRHRREFTAGIFKFPW